MSVQLNHLLGGLFLFFLFCNVVSAGSPDIERIAPKEVPTGDEGELIQDDLPEVTPTPDRDAVLVDALNGIVFIDDVNKLDPSGRSHESGIVLDGDLEIVDTIIFKQYFDEFLNQPITLNLLDKITNKAVRYYRNHDRPIVDVLAPEGQDITDGVLQLAVILGKRGDVRVEGAQYFSEEKLAANVRLKMSDTITQRELEEDITWMNSNPFRTVDVLFERGKEFGQTDVVLDVEDRFPLRVYGGVEDTGTELTGIRRWLTGFNWGNAFGLDHQLNYQYTSSFDTNVLNAHSFNYVAPLSWRHTATLFGAYVKSDPDPTSAGFNLDGENYQLGFRYNIPLTIYKKLNHELNLGYDFKRSNNNLDFGGLSVFSTFTNISQFSFAYNGNVKDKYGATSFGSTVYISPGDMMGDNRDIEFAASRALASADYIYSRFNINRITRLPKDFSWVAELQFQVSTNNLLGSEQFGIGGFQTVRGYDAYQAVGDEGILIRNEIRSPAFSFLKHLKIDVPKEDLQFLWFLDYGSVKNVDLLAGEGGTDLMSTGVGLRYSIAPYLTLRADYGWQLKALSATASKSSRLHAGLVISY
ncbi:MAG: ShlB/FhaC/HecB family hemolysin secretion/activation protein [Pseudomonadota bacterium]